MDTSIIARPARKRTHAVARIDRMTDREKYRSRGLYYLIVRNTPKALDLCLKRRGEATEVFLEDLPTYHLLPPAYYYLGCAQDGLQSAGGAQSYKTFLSIREKGDPDPLVQDARTRLAGR